MKQSNRLTDQGRGGAAVGQPEKKGNGNKSPGGHEVEDFTPKAMPVFISR